jgi:hypothetical protein
MVNETGIMILRAGDKVQIIKDVFDNNEYDIIMIATRGSIGKVLSYGEYCDYIKKEGAGASREYFLYIKKGMDEGTRYPVSFVKVVMPPKDFYDDWNEPVKMGCKVRRVCLLSVEFLEKL